MKKFEFVPPSLFLVGLSLFVMYSAYNMGLLDRADLAVEKTYNPGPGLMPFGSAVLLLLLSLYLLIEPLFKKGPSAQHQEFKKKAVKETNYRKIIIVLILLFGYALVLERMGYLLATCFALLLLFKTMNLKWRYSLFMSLTTTLVTYFGFTYLGLLLPDGIIKLQRYLL